MTDLHIRILTSVARQSQRDLDAHAEAGHAGDAVAAGRQIHLERAAVRTRAWLADAEERRREGLTSPRLS